MTARWLGLLAALLLGALVRLDPRAGRDDRPYGRALGALRGTDHNPERRDLDAVNAYYEVLLDRGRGAGFVDEPAGYRACSTAHPGSPGSMWAPLNDWRAARIRPSFTATCYGASWRTNALGFRDGPWPARAEEPGVLRIGVLGSSHVAGLGVEQPQALPAALERRLNAGLPHRVYRVLNLGLPGYSDLMLVGALPEVLAAEPDVVVLISHGRADDHLQTRELALLRQRPELAAGLPAAARAALPPDGAPTDDARPALDRAALAVLHDRLAERGVPIVYARLPLLTGPLAPDRERDSGRDVARELGYRVVDIDDVYQGEDREDLRCHPWDFHPSAEAHERVARALARALPPDLRGSTQEPPP